MNDPGPTAAITAIEYHLPDKILSNEELALEFPEWNVDTITAKTGIKSRRVSAQGELSSDLAYAAARKLFDSGVIASQDIDFLLFCTQSADYALPTSACLLQDRLGIPTTAGSLDFNLGCSGFVYGLGLCQGLIHSGQARNILLLTGETYTKFIFPQDKSVRTIFGDAGAATLVQKSATGAIGPFVYGSDGRGGPNLVCHKGGLRGNDTGAAAGRDALWMNGPEIFNFTLEVVPRTVRDLLERAEMKQDDVDLFVFHQANRYMMDHLRTKLKVPKEKFVVELEHVGNTVSSTIPIALREAARRGELRPGMRVMLVGFGVGYSWGAAMITWSNDRAVM